MSFFTTGMIKIFTKHLIVRYIISGGISATVNLSIFSLLFYVFRMHYILSSIIAFALAFFVSLSLQKFWTFRDHSTDNMHIQGFYYLLSSLLGLSVNTVVLYALVHYLHFIPIVGQIVAGISTALCTFPISRKFIFKERETL
jgi:putative flippase GtrA